MSEYPTSEAVLNTSEEDLAGTIERLCEYRRSGKWAKEKAQKIRAAAVRNPFKNIAYESHLVSLDMLITLLLQHQVQLANLEHEIDVLAGEIEEYQIIQSIPGIGPKIAATILSEVGEINRFNHAKKLVAFAGVDPSVYSSGKFTATINRITKRGSKRLRRALFLAVQLGLRRCANKKLKAFYDKKRKEGKPYKVAIIACVNKLLHWIYALLKHKETFLDIA